MSDAAKPFAATHPRDRAFFLAFAALSIAAIAGGFLPRLSTIFSGERSWPPFSVHVHAALFYGWIALLAAQVLLVRKGKTQLHRKLGYLGLGLAVAMVAVGFWMTITMVGWRLERGDEGALAFLPVPLLDLTSFAVLIAAAGLLRSDPAAHKRLILMCTTVLLAAGFGRMNLHAMPPTPWLPQVEMFVNLYGTLWIVMALAIAYDVATRGRAHWVYWIATPFVVAMQFAAASLLVWPGWKPFAMRTLGLG